jgi:hypothetical protein
MLESLPAAPAAARSSASWRIAISRAWRCWRKLNAAVAAWLALKRSALAMRPAPGRSSSERNAPRGSDAIASIVPARGPSPNRCRACAATAFGGADMLSCYLLRDLDGGAHFLAGGVIPTRQRTGGLIAPMGAQG